MSLLILNSPAMASIEFEFNCEDLVSSKAQKTLIHLKSLVSGSGTVTVTDLQTLNHLSIGDGDINKLADQISEFTDPAQTTIAFLPDTATHLFDQMATTYIDFESGVFSLTKDKKQITVNPHSKNSAKHTIILKSNSDTLVLFHELIHIKDLAFLEHYSAEHLGPRETLEINLAAFKIITELRAYKAIVQKDPSLKARATIYDLTYRLRNDLSQSMLLLKPIQARQILELFGLSSHKQFELYLTTDSPIPDMSNLLEGLFTIGLAKVIKK